MIDTFKKKKINYLSSKGGITSSGLTTPKFCKAINESKQPLLLNIDNKTAGKTLFTNSVISSFVSLYSCWIGVNQDVFWFRSLKEKKKRKSYEKNRAKKIIFYCYLLQQNSDHTDIEKKIAQ